jgi:hypothetical protein
MFNVALQIVLTVVNINELNRSVKKSGLVHQTVMSNDYAAWLRERQKANCEAMFYIFTLAERRTAR